MSSYVIGLAVSIIVLALLLAVFRHEERTGMRFAAPVRLRLDYAVLRVGSVLFRLIDIMGSSSIRQVFHYILHSILRFVLHINRRWEMGLRNMMRVNKTFARDAERERTTRSKLEEVALHKLKHSLTDEQKRKHRDEMLEG